MDNERDAKLAILNGLAGNYSATLAPETSKMWLFLLADYPVEQVQAAALNVIRKHSDVPYKSMPPFAMMQRELDALDGTVRGEENVALQAEAEWDKLLEDIEGWGAWRGQPDDLHPVTARVVRMMGGWRVACAWLEKDLNWRHKEFTELWEQVQGKEEFVAIGAHAVKQLELPPAKREMNMAVLQDFKRSLCAMPQNVLEEPKPKEPEGEPKPSVRTEYVPKLPRSREEEDMRNALLALREMQRATPAEAVA